MSRPFRSFTPLKEKQFWPHVFHRNGTRRLVSVFRSSLLLVSDNLSNRQARYESASRFVHLYTIFKVSSMIKSLTVCQPSFLVIGRAEAL